MKVYAYWIVVKEKSSSASWIPVHDPRNKLHEFYSRLSSILYLSFLMNSFQVPIYNYIRRLVVSHEDAEDVLQEVFIRIYQHLESPFTIRGTSFTNFILVYHQFYIWALLVRTQMCFRRSLSGYSDISINFAKKVHCQPGFTGLRRMKVYATIRGTSFTNFILVYHQFYIWALLVRTQKSVEVKYKSISRRKFTVNLDLPDCDEWKFTLIE